MGFTEEEMKEFDNLLMDLAGEMCKIFEESGLSEWEDIIKAPKAGYIYTISLRKEKMENDKGKEK